MTIRKFARLLNNREYGNEITSKEEELAKELGFVVVFGSSDDLAELRGAINDEVGCYGSGRLYLDKDGIFEECDCRCSYSQKFKQKCKIIEALWCKKDDVLWTYETDIPHETFNILEDGEVFCRGIVFKIENLL